MRFVHGDIRHLEIQILQILQGSTVHGDIRHLEIKHFDFIAVI